MTEPLSVTILTVLRVESKAYWQVWQCERWCSSCWRSSRLRLLPGNLPKSAMNSSQAIID